MFVGYGGRNPGIYLIWKKKEREIVEAKFVVFNKNYARRMFAELEKHSKDEVEQMRREGLDDEESDDDGDHAELQEARAEERAAEYQSGYPDRERQTDKGFDSG